MSFFKKLANLFSPPRPQTPAMWVSVKCNRCGEVIRSRVNLYNDLSLEYGEDGGTSYICRKLLIGEGRCFQRVEIELTFDDKRNLVNHTVTGGVFVEAD